MLPCSGAGISLHNHVIRVWKTIAATSKSVLKIVKGLQNWPRSDHLKVMTLLHNKLQVYAVLRTIATRNEFVMAWEIGVRVASVHAEMRQILFP